MFQQIIPKEPFLMFYMNNIFETLFVIEPSKKCYISVNTENDRLIKNIENGMETYLCLMRKKNEKVIF